MPSYQYRDFHDEYKTVSRPSYHHNGNPYIKENGLYIEERPWFLYSAYQQLVWKNYAISKFMYLWPVFTTMGVNGLN